MYVYFVAYGFLLGLVLVVYGVQQGLDLGPILQLAFPWANCSILVPCGCAQVLVLLYKASKILFNI